MKRISVQVKHGSLEKSIFLFHRNVAGIVRLERKKQSFRKASVSKRRLNS